MFEQFYGGAPIIITLAELTQQLTMRPHDGRGRQSVSIAAAADAALLIGCEVSGIVRTTVLRVFIVPGGAGISVAVGAMPICARASGIFGLEGLDLVLFLL